MTALGDCLHLFSEHLRKLDSLCLAFVVTSVQTTDLAKFWNSHREAQASWLAVQLRSYPLTILHGRHGSGKTELLCSGLMPLLQRRADDRTGRTVWDQWAPLNASANSTASAVVMPFPDRRQAVRLERAAKAHEIVIYQSRWDDSPLDSIWQALDKRMGTPRGNPAAVNPRSTDASLAEALLSWHVERGTRFLFVFDGFDECIAGSVSNPDAAEFIDQWLRIVVDGRGHSHFLLALSEPAEPLWRLLVTHLVGLGELQDHLLQLPDGSVAPFASVSETSTGTQLGGLGAEQRGAEAIEETPELDPEIAENWAGLPRPPMNSDYELLNKAMRPPALEKSRPSGRLIWPIAAAFGLPVVLGAWIAWSGHSEHSADHPPLTASTLGYSSPPVNTSPVHPAVMATPVLKSPDYELVADTSNSSDTEAINDLTRLLTPKGQASPLTTYAPGWYGELRLLADKPRLAVATYDVLQAARTSGIYSLQIVSPLFSVEVYFLVRKDSPLQFIHQIRTAKINVGPSEGSRALTANGIYRSMFGVAIPATQANTSAREEALTMLLDAKSIDVLVLVGAQPDPWLTNMREDRKRGLRLLQLDPDNATSRKATGIFLPTLVKPASGSGLEAPEGTRTLGLMTFLVTGGAAQQGVDPDVQIAVESICRNLPALKQSGHPKWREVQPGMQLDIGWPNSNAAAEAFKNC